MLTSSRAQETKPLLTILRSSCGPPVKALCERLSPEEIRRRRSTRAGRRLNSALKSRRDEDPRQLVDRQGLGVDAARAARSSTRAAVPALLTTINEAFDRVAMHAVRRELLEAQAEAAGLPLHVSTCRGPARTRSTKRGWPRRSRRLEADGFTHVAFGDLFLEDVRRYREERLAGTGLTPLFPLWKTKPTGELAGEMIDGGLAARLTCVDPRSSTPASPGRLRRARCSPTCPRASIRAARTASSTRSSADGPMFSAPVPVEVGERRRPRRVRLRRRGAGAVQFPVTSASKAE